MFRFPFKARDGAFPVTLLLMLCSFFLCSRADAGATQEYTVKAALLLNFARFTEWPPETLANSKNSIRLCFIGNDIVRDSFAPIEGRPVGDRKLEVRQLGRARNPSGCHLLFVSGSNREQLPQIFSSIQNQPVLTVGEMPGFAELGGTINLAKQGRKIKIEINIDTASNAGLKISSRLLKLATLVGE